MRAGGEGQATKPAPHPIEFTDLNTGERNSLVTPGGMARAIGSHNIFQRTAPDTVVFSPCNL